MAPTFPFKNLKCSFWIFKLSHRLAIEKAKVVLPTLSYHIYMMYNRATDMYITTYWFNSHILKTNGDCNGYMWIYGYVDICGYGDICVCVFSMKYSEYFAIL